MYRRTLLTGTLGVAAGCSVATPAAPSTAPAAVPSVDHLPPSPPPSPSPTPSPTPSPSAPPAFGSARAGDLTARLSRRQQAGQTICVGVVPADSPSYIASLVDRLCLGGIFLLGHWTDARQLDRMLQAVHAVAPQGIRALIATDHEGGEIQNVRIPGVTRIPSAESLAATSVANAQQVSAAGAAELAGLGIHMIFSPVADVVDPALGTANKPIAGHHRGFGSDPAKVASYVEAVFRGHHSAGIVSTVKHFPGIGRITEDTDFKATGITDDTTTVDDPYLQGFSAAFAAGCEAVMIASAYYTQIDPGTLALFSRKVMVDLLRTRHGFGGLVVSDDLGSSVSVFGVPAAQRARKHVENGGDFALTADPATAASMVDELVSWSSGGAAEAARLAEAARRVLTTKDAHGLLV